MSQPAGFKQFGGVFAHNSKLTVAQGAEIWSAAHRRFAEGCSGFTTAFVRGAWEKSIFYRIEFPVLRANPKVTEIVFRSGE